MRLPWHRERIPPERRLEAEAAYSDAEERYQEAKARGPQVAAIALVLREARRQNHFAERFRRPIEEGHHAHGG